MEATTARNIRSPIGQAGKIILVPFIKKKNSVHRNLKIQFLTATDEKFRPQPPCETARRLLNELHIVEPTINNATNIRNSICK